MNFGNIAPMLSNSQQWCMCTLRQQTIKLIHSLQPPLPSSIESIKVLNFRSGIQTKYHFVQVSQLHIVSRNIQDFRIGESTISNSHSKIRKTKHLLQTNDSSVCV